MQSINSMDIFETYKRQLNLAKEQFSHIVEAADVIPTPSGLPHKLSTYARKYDDVFAITKTV